MQEIRHIHLQAANSLLKFDYTTKCTAAVRFIFQDEVAKSGKRLVDLDRVLFLSSTERIKQCIKERLEPENNRRKKCILLSCMRHFLKKRAEIFGTVGRPSLAHLNNM